MTWNKKDEELFEELKNIPDIPVKSETKKAMLADLLKAERSMMPKNTYGRRLRRILGTSLASVAGLGIVTIGILAYGHMNSPFLSNGSHLASDSKKTTVSRKPEFFGYHVPFTPMIPTKMPAGYKLATTKILMTYSNRGTRFNGFVASYKATVQTPTQQRQRPIPPVINIYETFGESIQKYAASLGLPQKWDRIAQIKGQAYYVTNAEAGHDAGGFVKNHVTYIVDDPMGGKTSANELLKYFLEYAQSRMKIAPVQVLDIVGTGYKNASGVVTFRTFVPKALYSTYHLYSATGEVQKSEHGTVQSVTLIFKNTSNPNQRLWITEFPFHGTQTKQHSLDNVHGYRLNWENSQQGLEFQIGGNLSTAEFQNVYNLFRTTQ